MANNVIKEDTLTLEQVATNVAGPLGTSYKDIAITVIKTIAYTLYKFLRALLYLLLLIPQLIQLIVFLLVLYVISKLWGSMKSIYEIFATLFNAIIPGPLFAWNIIAMIFNIISKALRVVGLRLPSLPVVKNPNGVKLPNKMPTAIEFVMLVLGPVANATKKTVHGYIYA